MIVRNFLSGAEEKPKSTIYVTGLNSTDTVYATSPSGKRVNAVWGQKKNPAFVLPSGMKQLEYIQTQGAPVTAFIDTGITPSNNLDYRFEFMPLQFRTGGNSVFGGRRSDGGYDFYFNGYSYGLSFVCGGAGGYKDLAQSYKLTANQKYVIEKQGLNFLKDGEMVASFSPPAWTPQITIYLGRSNNGGTSEGYSSRIYSNELSRGNDKLRHFIPVEYNGAVGMWDLVSNTFFGNSGTGSFIAGPEVPEYIDCFIFEVSELGNFVITTPTTTQNVLVDEVGEYLVEF